MLTCTAMSETRTVEPESSTERLLDTHEVAAWLGLSPNTLRYWRHVHRGPPSLTVGAAVRYRRDDVERWLERGAKRGAA